MGIFPGGSGGVGASTADAVSVAATPISYTPSAPTCEGHFIGIDAAIAALVLGSIPDGSITQAKLATDSVSTAKIEDGAVTPAKQADVAAWTVRLRNAATTGELQDVLISALTELGSPATGDWILGMASTGELRKLNVGNLPGGGGGLEYQGTWNASTNTPTLSNGSGSANHYYVVSAAGSTSLDGITDWDPGDWAIHNDVTGTWQKVDNSESVASVNGRVGAVTTALSDYDFSAETSETTPLDADLLVLEKASGGAKRKLTAEQLFKSHTKFGGGWNAATNTPTLDDSDTDVEGVFYVVTAYDVGASHAGLNGLDAKQFPGDIVYWDGVAGQWSWLDVTAGGWGEIDQLSEDVSPSSGDWLLMVNSTGGVRKVDVGNLPSGGGSSDYLYIGEDTDLTTRTESSNVDTVAHSYSPTLVAGRRYKVTWTIIAQHGSTSTGGALFTVSHNPTAPAVGGTKLPGGWTDNGETAFVRYQSTSTRPYMSGSATFVAVGGAGNDEIEIAFRATASSTTVELTSIIVEQVALS